MLRRPPADLHARLKEPFTSRPTAPRFQAPGAAVHAPETLEEYLALFAPAAPGQLGARPPRPTCGPARGRAAIADARPDARIIAILREPASFLRSLHLQFAAEPHRGRAGLRRALCARGDRREGRHIPRRSDRPQLLLYSEHVRYVEQLRRYEDLFSRSTCSC